MGIIIGRFRKSKSTYDVLEKLEKEITSIEEFGRNTEQQRKKIIGRFILLAILTYLALALILYFYYNKIAPNRGSIYIILLIAFPIVIYFVKNFLAWYYSRKLRKHEKTLVKLKEEKKKILEKVMETETYKVAKEILDKFGNENKKQLISTDITPRIKPPNTIGPSAALPSSTGLRQRNVPVLPRNRLSFGAQESDSPFPRKPVGSAVSSTNMLPNRGGIGVTPRLGVTLTSTVPTPAQLPKEIIPKDRSILDKMVDYLVGDGPSNRYALICKKCYSHNGMALKEEFEYFAFKCCYCSHFNPARKKRFTAPSFQHKASLSKTLTPDSSDSDVSSLEPDEQVSSMISGPKGDSVRSIKQSDSSKLFDSSDQVDDPDLVESIPGSIEETSVLSPKDVEELSPIPMEVESAEAQSSGQNPFDEEPGTSPLNGEHGTNLESKNPFDEE